MSRGKRAAWHTRVRALNAGTSLEGWLKDRGSLTAKLVAHSGHFRVQCLRQQHARCLADEAAALHLPKAVQAWEREVLLRCDGQAVVFAHTVVPLFCTASDWPLFKALGERSLGTTLFRDPQVERGTMYYARLLADHPLRLRAQRALASPLPAQLLARRSLFRRHKGILLVTEVFLPALASLRPPVLAASIIESSRLG
jgi:chorismate lyase